MLDELRQVLQGKAVAAATANNFICKIGNEPFKQPTSGMFGEFWFRTDKTYPAELTGVTGYKCTIGLVQFTIYTPEGTGDGPTGRLADALAKVFNQKRFNVSSIGYVTFDPCNPKNIPGVRNGFVTTIVDATFDYYWRDETATPD
jgi:hypothetical protein